MKNILFYKYVQIEDLDSFREEHQSLCESLNLKGKVLVASEGINGCLTGALEDVESYIKAVRADPRFSDMEFKEGNTKNHNFKKTIVRIRPEIVTLKHSTNLEKKAPYIEPEKLKQLLDNNEDVILIDARNNYESKIGKFENAITPDIDLFSEFPSIINDLDHLKNKHIVTYCTGGIRCEKASAILIENGFKNVQQLHGGIINYGKKCSDVHWVGKCFVFDTRGAINIDPEKNSEPITQCEICNLPTDDYYNCALNNCDKRFLCCEDCTIKMKNCCSKNCRNKLIV